MTVLTSFDENGIKEVGLNSSLNDQNAAPLVPALQSNWLMMHVSMMMVSYATLIVGSLLFFFQHF